MRNKKHILFDFDGVIVDSFRSAYAAQRVICPDLTEDGYRERFEENINDWNKTKARHTPECRLDLDFFELYVPKLKSEVQMFPSMKEHIIELAQDHRLFIISSSTSDPIRELLEMNGIGKYFAWVMGNDVDQSKVEKMHMVFEKYEVTPDDCVFVTDTLGDLREAERVDVGAIAVTWGFHTPETLKKGNAFRLIDQQEVLPKTIFEYFQHIKNES